MLKTSITLNPSASSPFVAHVDIANVGGAAETSRGITRSGRVYQLGGPASHDPDADCVWAVWARLNQVPWFRDVTGEIETMLKPSRLH